MSDSKSKAIERAKANGWDVERRHEDTYRDSQGDDHPRFVWIVVAPNQESPHDIDDVPQYFDEREAWDAVLSEIGNSEEHNEGGDGRTK